MPGRRSTLRTLCELVVGAVILAVVLHTFAILGLVTPMYVSAGSMAPHLVGAHWKAECSACGGRFAVGVDAPPQAGRTTCPACGEIVLLDARRREPGDRLYVDRVTYRLRPPRRWEPLVFRCPEDARLLCIKRVIGLPGEAIRLEGGDLIVNDHLQRKSLGEQNALRVLVHRERPSARWWRPPDEGTAWQWTGRAWRSRPEAGRLRGGADWLELVPPHGPIADGVAYNAGVVAVENPTEDLMLSFRLAARATDARGESIHGGAGFLSIGCGPAGGSGSDGEDRLLVTIWPELRKARIGPLIGHPSHEPHKPRNGEASDLLEVTLSLFDRQLLVALDGEEVIRRPLDGPATVAERPFAIAAVGMDVELRDLAVWRDVVYTDRPRGSARSYRKSAHWQLGAGEYFVVGDNPAVSHDSRTWQRGPGLPAGLVIGKPIGVR